MRPLYRNILIIVFAGLVIGLAALWYTFRKPDVSVDTKKAEVEINASSLLEAFENDEAKANELYLGKIISVTGNVESISEDSVGISVFLKEDGDFAGILCSFHPSIEEATQLTRGNSVEIKGICSGYLMDVVLNRCALVSKNKAGT